MRLPSDKRRPLVITLGLAKTGTTSVKDYFECNQWSTTHHVCSRPSTHQPMRCAACFTDFVLKAQSVGNVLSAYRNGSYEYDMAIYRLQWSQPLFQRANLSTALSGTGRAARLDLEAELRYDCGENKFGAHTGGRLRVVCLHGPSGGPSRDSHRVLATRVLRAQLSPRGRVAAQRDEQRRARAAKNTARPQTGPHRQSL